MEQDIDSTERSRSCKLDVMEAGEIEKWYYAFSR
jgi:hypothetical protein